NGAPRCGTGSIPPGEARREHGPEGTPDAPSSLVCLAADRPGWLLQPGEATEAGTQNPSSNGERGERLYANQCLQVARPSPRRPAVRRLRAVGGWRNPAVLWACGASRLLS